LTVAEPPSYEVLVAGWKSLRARDGVTVREVAMVGAQRTMLVVDIVNASGAPTVAVAAGVHGDEPAAPWSLYSIVRDGLLAQEYNYRLWPCTNPSGYALGTRVNAEGFDVNRSFNRGGETPEARTIITANRDRTFALTLDLHEDFEADGFYCYEPVVAGTAPYGAFVIRALDDAGLPVQDLTDVFDLGYAPEASHLRALERGRVLPDPRAEMAHQDGWPYSLFLLRRAARRSLTLETPRRRAWHERIAMHRVAVCAALARLRDVA